MSDLINRQAVLDKFKALCDACGEGEKYNGVMCRCCALDDGICIVEDAPDAEPERNIIRCADCKWWDRLEDGHPYGYCRACRSGEHSERWEISIRRQCRMDFYCADAEPKENEDDDE